MSAPPENIRFPEPTSDRFSVFAATHTAAFQEDHPWSAHDIASLAASAGALLFGDQRAFVLGRVVADEAEILTIATHPQFQKQGLGRQVLRQFTAAATEIGACRIFLEVAADNMPACALYTSMGFEQVGLRRSYYARQDRSPVDALILCKVVTARESPESIAKAHYGGL